LIARSLEWQLEKPSQFVGTVSCQLCGHIGTFGNRDLTRNIGHFSKEIFVKNSVLECLLCVSFQFVRFLTAVYALALDHIHTYLCVGIKSPPICPS